MSTEYHSQRARHRNLEFLTDQEIAVMESPAGTPACQLRLVVKPEAFQTTACETQKASAETPYAYRPGWYDVAVKRGLDFMAALILLAILLPVLAATTLVLFVRKGKVFEKTTKLGRHCKAFTEYAFAMKSGRLRDLPVLFNILKGDMSFVGPRAGTMEEFCPECCASLRQDPRHGFWRHPLKNVRMLQRPVSGSGLHGTLTPREHAARLRNHVRPGLISEFWVLQKVNQAYDPETRIDAEYVQNISFQTDLSLLLRALPAIVCHFVFGPEEESRRRMQDRIRILDITMDNITMQDAIGRIMGYVNQGHPRHVCFVNPQYANVAYTHDAYKAVLQSADLVLADGIGMKIAGKMLRREIKENVNGTDLFPRLCQAMAEGARRLYLLGAAPGVAEAVRAWVEKNHPGVKVTGCHDGYFTAEEEPAIIREIAQSGADVLLVAMGVPNQELWIKRNLPALGVKVAIGVGGLFDFYSGRIPRAPMWVREIGMEWFYRFSQEPSRLWKRYFVGNNLFLFRVLMARLREKDQPLQPVIVPRN